MAEHEVLVRHPINLQLAVKDNLTLLGGKLEINSERSEVSTRARESFRMASGRIFCVRQNFLS